MDGIECQGQEKKDEYSHSPEPIWLRQDNPK